MGRSRQKGRLPAPVVPSAPAVPLTPLEMLKLAQDNVDAAVRERDARAMEALRCGAGFADVARATGITRQGARKRYGEPGVQP